jgi:hypothetical protein
VSDSVHDIISLIKKLRLDVVKEKETQAQIERALADAGHEFCREYRLDNKNIPDFFFHENGIAMEVKLKGQIVAIYKQCQRYAQFDQVKHIILVSNKRMGFPAEINGKSCYFVQIGKAWL